MSASPVPTPAGKDAQTCERCGVTANDVFGICQGCADELESWGAEWDGAE